MTYNTIPEVLADMDGSNWTVTEAQVQGIRYLLDLAKVQYRNVMLKILSQAYEAGTKHDVSKRKSIHSMIIMCDLDVKEMG